MKRNLILLTGLTTCFAFVATITLAQQGSPSVTSVKQEIRAEVRSEIGSIKDESLLKRQELENEFKKKAEENRNQLLQKKVELKGEVEAVRNSASTSRAELQNELKKKAEEARLEFTKNRDEARAEMEKNRVEFRKELVDKKLEAKEQIAKKRAELAEKLKVIKDEKKQQIALKVGDQFQQINTKVLANFTSTLSREEVILQKLSSRADVLSIQGVDTASLKEAMSFVQTEISKARDAIVAQTAKVYTIAVKTEATLKNDTGSTRQELQRDLNTVKTLIKSVHDALKNAADIFGDTDGANKMRVSQPSTTTSSTNQ